MQSAKKKIAKTEIIAKATYKRQKLYENVECIPLKASSTQKL